MPKDREDITFHISTASVVKTIVVILLFVIIYLLRDLVLVLLAAIVVASSIEPITKWFIARKVPRLPSVIVIYFSMAAIIIGTFYFLVVPLLNESSSFITTLPQYIDKGSQTIQENSFIQSAPIFKQLSSTFTFDNFSNEGSKIIAKLAGGFWNTIGVVFGNLLNFCLIIILSFYLSVQENGVGKFLKIISSRRYEKYIVGLWKRAEVKIGLWMQGQLILVAIIAVIVYLGLSLFGIRHALLLAMLAGLFELIPLFGPILAAIPAVLIGFVDGGLSLGLIVLGFFLIVQQFENQLIYPLVVKKVVGVSPIIVIIALVAGAQLGGFLGLLLSVPLAAVIMEFINDLEQDKISSEATVTQI
ncbi:AI-2E family transporter [Candidatus Parcubacteria bacterium]|nr:AI-2E family transporter [Candidatus Parcubacteria bacterium]